MKEKLFIYIHMYMDLSVKPYYIYLVKDYYLNKSNSQKDENKTTNFVYIHFDTVYLFSPKLRLYI